MITMICFTFLRYKGKVDDDMFAGGMVVAIIELLIDLIGFIAWVST